MEYEVELGGGHSVLQDTEGYRFTEDSVICAGLLSAGSRDRLLDLGCGTGIIGVLALLKKGVREVVGIDADEDAVRLARANAERNFLSERMTALVLDVRDAAKALGRESFDKVVCNPPYFDFSDGTDGGRTARAKRESTARLDDFVRTGGECLRFGGDFTLVMRADRLCDAVAAFRAHGMEPKRTVMIFPHPGAQASSFVMTARKGGRPGVGVSALCVRDERGAFTPETEEIYSWQNFS